MYQITIYVGSAEGEIRIIECDEVFPTIAAADQYVEDNYPDALYWIRAV